jgi:hypothetical protein
MRNGGWGGPLGALALLCVAFSPAARAETTTLEGGAAPIVRVSLGPQATLTIRTWDRQSVQIEADPGSVNVERKTGHVGSTMPPVLIQMARVARGADEIDMPAESFVVGSVAQGQHELFRITPNAKHSSPGLVVVTVPADTALITASVERGSVTIRDYRNGTFIVHLRNGQAVLQNVGGDGFVQVLQGTMQAFDSNFDRLRSRTALGNQIFQRCHSRQIEAWSSQGTLVYDAGTFEPGLARFESIDGNVAIGVSGASQLIGRSGIGNKVMTQFEKGVTVETRFTETNATVSGGGPLVSAFSGTGTVFLYDGGLNAKRKLSPDWKPALTALRAEPPPPPVQMQSRFESIPSPAPILPRSRRRPHP